MDPYDAYFRAYKEVFDTYAVDDSRSEVEWEYRRQPFRIRYEHQSDSEMLMLDYITYNDRYEPRYHNCFIMRAIAPNVFEDEAVEVTAVQLPYDSRIMPQLVLRSLLTGVQNSIRLKRQEGLIE